MRNAGRSGPLEFNDVAIVFILTLHQGPVTGVAKAPTRLMSWYSSVDTVQEHELVSLLLGEIFKPSARAQYAWTHPYESPCLYLPSDELSELSKTLALGHGGDRWLRSIRADDLEDSRTVVITLHPPSNDAPDSDSQHELMLMPPVSLAIYFPESDTDAPFCFSEGPWPDDAFEQAVADVVRVANSKIRPLASESLLALLATLQRAVGAERERLWPSGPAPSWAKRWAVSMIAARIANDRLACELSLAFLSTAANSYRRDSIADPLPFPPYSSMLHDTPLPPPQFLEKLAARLDNIPPLKSLHCEQSVSSLPVDLVALLVAVLFAAPVQFRTVHSPSSQGSTKDPWAELQVIGRCPSWNFEHLKKKHGALEGYHGSAAENWHSISQKGLKNRSNTRHQKNGAIFGDGVYLASECIVSRGFAQRGSEHPRCHTYSALGSRIKGALSERGAVRPEFPFEVVARCDVINLPVNIAPKTASAAAGSDESDYYVVRDESHVDIQSLLLFPSDLAGSSDAATPVANLTFRSMWTYFVAALAVASYFFVYQAP